MNRQPYNFERGQNIQSHAGVVEKMIAQWIERACQQI